MSKNLFVGNEAMWMKLAESENDYAIFYVKNWIPFNAWFYNTYKLENDRQHIEAIKGNVNPVRDKIIALLMSTTSEGMNFRTALAMFHEALEDNGIRSNSKKLSFSDIYFRKNTMNTKSDSFNGVKYFVGLQPTKDYRVVVENTRTKPKQTLYVNQSIKNVEALKNDLKASSLDLKQQAFLVQCFEEAIPEKRESLLTENRKQSIKIGNHFFIKDEEAIAQALIEVLYLLRCALFHGEIIPNAQNLSVYEPAFQILRVLVKTLDN